MFPCPQGWVTHILLFFFSTLASANRINLPRFIPVPCLAVVRLTISIVAKNVRSYTAAFIMFLPCLAEPLNDLELFVQKLGPQPPEAPLRFYSKSNTSNCVWWLVALTRKKWRALTSEWLMNYSVFWRSRNELSRLESAVLNLCLVDSLLLCSELWKLWKLRIPTVNSLPVSCLLLHFLFFKADSFLCSAVEILMSARQTLFSAIKEDYPVSWDWFHVQYLLRTKLCV